MPLPPPPMTFKCTRCSWSKTTAPTSDALHSGDWFQKCPQCGSPDLQISRARVLAALLAKASRYINI
ncbi:hypothetical protein FKF78_12145 [Aeromonas hydrophila]|nr:hypothetical protein [Aeromonas hydrophila]